MKKTPIKIRPMNVKEVTHLNRMCKLYGYDRKSVPNTNGTFNSVKVQSISPFDFKEMKAIREDFKKQYGKELMFDIVSDKSLKDIHIGYFSVKAIREAE